LDDFIIGLIILLWLQSKKIVPIIQTFFLFITCEVYYS